MGEAWRNAGFTKFPGESAQSINPGDQQPGSADTGSTEAGTAAVPNSFFSPEQLEAAKVQHDLARNKISAGEPPLTGTVVGQVPVDVQAAFEENQRYSRGTDSYRQGE